MNTENEQTYRIKVNYGPATRIVFGVSRRFQDIETIERNLHKSMALFLADQHRASSDFLEVWAEPEPRIRNRPRNEPKYLHCLDYQSDDFDFDDFDYRNDDYPDEYYHDVDWPPHPETDTERLIDRFGDVWRDDDDCAYLDDNYYLYEDCSSIEPIPCDSPALRKYRQLNDKKASRKQFKQLSMIDLENL